MLVMLNHAFPYAGLLYGDDSGFLTSFLHVINTALAPLRMELMFLLSGIFVERGLRKGIGIYFAGKVRNIAYPYVIWSLIIFVLIKVGVLVKGENVEWVYLVRILLGSTVLTWFLCFLFLFYVAMLYVRRFPAVFVITGSLFLALCLPDEISSMVIGYNEGFLSINDLFYYFIYFYIGDLLGLYGINKIKADSNFLFLGSLISLAILFFLSCSTSFSKTWPGYLPLVVIGLPAVFRASVILSKSIFGTPLAYIGRNSIVFYLVHYPIYIVAGFVLKQCLVGVGYIYFIILMLGLMVSFCVSRLRVINPSSVDFLFAPDDIVRLWNKALYSKMLVKFRVGRSSGNGS